MSFFRILVLFTLLTGATAQAAPFDLEAISQAADTKVSMTEDGAARITWPRTDVKVTVDGLALPPFAGLTSWAALTPAPGGMLLMGDTVVFEDEVNPAMDTAFAQGLEVTGLHNHFFFDQPKVYFMHLGGHGAPDMLAAGVKAVWDTIQAVRKARPEPARMFHDQPPARGGINPRPIEHVLSAKAQTQDGMVKVSFGREGEMHGVTVSEGMGLSTWAAFVGSDADAVVDGDFIITADEVRPVLKALHQHGIQIVALHNHMIGETPTYYFTHFWGRGPAVELARAVRAALDAQAK